MDMPYGYRWTIKEDFSRSPYSQSLIISFGEGMIEFVMDHEHDHIECERMIALMGYDTFVDDSFSEVDEFGQTSWVD